MTSDTGMSASGEEGGEENNADDPRWSSAPFVDVRLHVPVRPTLEYSIPAVARTVKDCLLGDTTLALTLPSLEACVVSGPHARGRGTTTGGDRSDQGDPVSRDGRYQSNHRDDEVVVHLQAAMSNTLSLVHEYLVDLSEAWKTYLKTTHAHVTRVVRVCDDEFRLVVGVRPRRDARRLRAVGDDVSHEVQRLRSKLEESLGRIRDSTEPTTPRPEPLITACEQLRSLFSSAYGRVPTRRLLRLKESFEDDLDRTQMGISEDFLGCCTRLLSD